MTDAKLSERKLQDKCPNPKCASPFKAVPFCVTGSHKCVGGLATKCHRGPCGFCRDTWHDAIVSALSEREERGLREWCAKDFPCYDFPHDADTIERVMVLL